MKKVAFRSGVHPNDEKIFSKDKKIISISTSEIMVFPISQHIGAPAKPLVKVGDEVSVGMKIAEAGGFISSPVYSSVSGTVKAIESRPLHNGRECDCIVIKNDFMETPSDEYGKERNCDELSSEEIRNIITESGIVGMGGAGFPTGVKLSPKDSNSIDYIIINGAECEPYLTSDYRIMLEHSNEILHGIEFVLKLFSNAKAIIAIEDNKSDAIEHLIKECRNYKNISVEPLKTKYPQGGERRLIASVTGRKINSHLLPADAGVVVLNIATTKAIYEAVALSKPLISRIVTVTGDGANHPGNYEVKLGTSVADLVDECGGLKENTVKIISGGPMMGMAMPSLDYPVTKTFSSVLALTRDDVEKLKTSACIRCGKCVGVCPENLVPQLLMAAAKNEDYEKYETLGGMECIECGCCTYTCPARRPLTQTFKLAKAEVRSSKVRK